MNRRGECGWKLALFPVHTGGTLTWVFILAYFRSDILGSPPGVEDKPGPVSSKPTSGLWPF